MLEFDVKSRVQPVGQRKGQTVYYAQMKSQQKLTNKMLVERIVRETSLSEGDVKNALKTPKIVFTPKQKMHDAANHRCPYTVIRTRPVFRWRHWPEPQRTKKRII